MSLVELIGRMSDYKLLLNTSVEMMVVNLYVWEDNTWQSIFSIPHYKYLEHHHALKELIEDYRPSEDGDAIDYIIKTFGAFF